MDLSRILAAVGGIACAAAAGCSGSSTLLGESDGGDGAPVDTYWAAPIDAGDAGGDEVAWRDGGAPWSPPPVPYCEAQWDSIPYDLWSDASGIYVLYGWTPIRPDPHLSGSWIVDQPPVLTVSHNGGAGWTEFYRGTCDRFSSGTCPQHMGWMLGGYLLGWGTYGPLYGFQPGTVTPLADSPNNAGSVFVVNDHLAYAMWQAGPDSRVVRYDGTGWSPVPVALPFASASSGKIWADEHDVFVAGESAVLLSLDTDAWRIHDPGTLSDLSAIWGFGGDDVWVGSWDGKLIHYDGTAWADVPWPSLDDGSTCNEQKPIEAMWGADGILYFITDTQFARWDGTRVEVLGHWALTFDDSPGANNCVGGMRPIALWGNSPTEVFLAVARPTSAAPGRWCDGVAILWWDGTTLRQI